MTRRSSRHFNAASAKAYNDYLQWGSIAHHNAAAMPGKPVETDRTPNVPAPAAAPAQMPEEPKRFFPTDIGIMQEITAEQLSRNRGFAWIGAHHYDALRSYAASLQERLNTEQEFHKINFEAAAELQERLDAALEQKRVLHEQWKQRAEQAEARLAEVEKELNALKAGLCR